ncbi:3-methyl-2-oxobutanoate hydroxymethyltransferase [Lebetimonas natsushimae]|uniref:3-methyl-2-oxobutanoate hydroxymethyltransferase n=1 Tax=Lebetimonas natsushimae TaxID=1936991 RepID=A0A292YDP3_9BACT|nr:3-methyl-2-oxobutanoate hydroxymethyltransferase [Lebetimonas natsushimae]GAX88047.1 3-methyl-2-oxobutanoate hydroxymethyltransferase [Lebetimonas natsushimae]
MKNTLNKLYKKEKLTMITAYDALFAKIFDDIADIILVGDSLNMSFMGESDTLTATMDQMIYHTKAVCNGAKKAYIVCDMPFGSYSTPEKALENAIRVYKETKADAVKLEGGAEKAKTVKLLTNNAIAVVGHIGLMPQFSRSEGGYRVKGKDEFSKQKLIEDAKAIEEAGAVMLVIEGVKEEVAKEITEMIDIPTIGIGAGRYTTGQVLVWSDMLGFFEEFKPKFVRRYLNGAEKVREAVKKYVEDVKSGNFPGIEEIY